MALQVLLVEDEPQDMSDLRDALPGFFKDHNIEVDLHECPSFERAFALVNDPVRRFDLIVSDTYRGDTRKGDAQALNMVEIYREGRFCPLVVYSSGSQPVDLKEGPFVVWADKTKANDIEGAIAKLLNTGIPQMAHQLHLELDKTAGKYLWGFLEKRWEQLKENSGFDRLACERLIRRRASTQLARIVSIASGAEPAEEVDGVEYYIYPPLNPPERCLGEVIQSTDTADDIRVILTPHCRLAVRAKKKPNASRVLTVKTSLVRDVLGPEKLDKVAQYKTRLKRHKKLKQWATPPSKQDVGTPEGRYWYLPGFLDIPHCFCDFEQVVSITHDRACTKFKPLAVLAPPFAESLQACFLSYYASVGLPDIRPESIEDVLNADAT